MDEMMTWDIYAYILYWASYQSIWVGYTKTMWLSL